MARTEIQITLRGRSIGISKDGYLVINHPNKTQLVVAPTGLLYTDASNITTTVGGGGSWGSITGTISSQSDLVANFAPLSPTLNAQSGTTYTIQASDLGKDLTFSNASGCTVTVPASLGVGFNCNFIKTSAAGNLTFVASSTTLNTDSGSLVMSAVNGAGSLVPVGTDIYNLTGPFGTLPGSTLDLNGTSITSTRAIAASDFGTGIVVLNSGSVIALTLPTVASMSLAATTGRVRQIIFYVAGAGIPTFAGATSSTSINGTAGTSTVLPLGGAPVQYGYYVLVQTAVGADTWSLS